MTSYTALDTTRFSGTPVECFSFVVDGSEYNYCSGNIPVTVDGKVFNPLEIERTRIRATDDITDQTTVDISMPVDCALIQAVAFGTDARDVDVTVYRTHYAVNDGTFQVLWRGTALGFPVEGRRATVKTGNLFQVKFLGNFNAVYYQLRCDHVLYGSRCQVDETAHDYSVTISSIDTDTNTINFTGDTVAADALENGEMVTSEGVRVGIVENTAGSFKLSYIPSGLAVSDVVTLYDGCNHYIDDCDTKFSNTVNYGGFPNIPDTNPYG